MLSCKIANIFVFLLIFNLHTELYIQKKNIRGIEHQSFPIEMQAQVGLWKINCGKRSFRFSINYHVEQKSAKHRKICQTSIIY